MDTTTQKQRRVSEKSLKNLKPFKPGVSGNPGGIPRHGRIDATIRDFMGPAEKLALVEAMYTEALGGNVQAAAWLADRGWGKVPDKLDLENRGAPLFEFVNAVYNQRTLNRVTNELTRESVN